MIGRMRQPLHIAGIGAGQNQKRCERRRSGRVRQQSLRCNLGQIVDVSATGMRIRRCWYMPVGTAKKIKIKGFPLAERLVAQVMWCRRAGFFAHEIGIQFVHADANVLQRLATVAGCSGLRRMVESSAFAPANVA
jgi:hypothetical protein